MTVTTVPVTVRLADFGGGSDAGIIITARMSDVDYTPDGTFVSNEPVTATTDADGIAVLNLFPNAVSPSGLGTRGTIVRVKATLPNSRKLSVLAVIPNEPVSLTSCVVSQEVTGLDASQMAAADSQAAARLAKRWATQIDAEVEAGQGFGAKKYAIYAADDALQTAADRVQTGLDRAATTADRTQTGLDRAATTADAGTASSAKVAAQSAQTLAEAAVVTAQNIVASVRFATKALMDADLAHNAGDFALVYSDATAANNGLYYKVGASGAGSWAAYQADRQTLADQRVSGAAGDAYALSNAVVVGVTTPNTSTYPAVTDTLFPLAVTASRGYLQDFSVRMSAAGTGQIIVLAPDAQAPYDYDVLAVVNVAPGAAGINTWQGSQIYTGEIPAGSRIGYRWLTGGAPRLEPGGGARLQTTAQVAGTAMAGDVRTTTDTYAVSFTIRPVGVASSLDARMVKAEAGTNQIGIDSAALLGSNLTASSVTTGDTGLAVTGALSIAFVYAIDPTTQVGILESVTLPIAASAQPDFTLFDFRIAIGVPNAAGTIIVSNLFTVKVAANKTNVVTGFRDANGAPLIVPAGAYVILQPTSANATINYHSGLVGYKTYTVGFGGALTVGATVALGDYVETPIFSYTLRSAAGGPINPRLTEAERKQALLIGPSNPVALERTQFAGTSLPAGWTATAGWTVSDGLTPPGVGGAGVKALGGTYTALWKHEQLARITINSADTITGLAQSPPENSGGAALLIDGVAGKLRLYAWDDTGALGGIKVETALPAALVAGRDYTLEFVKNGFTISGTFRDTVTQQTCSVTFDGTATYTMAHGKPGALFISATTPPKYNWLEYVAPYPRKCRALIIGDSIAEAQYIGPSPSWAQQIANARATQNDVVLAPRAGDETPNFLLRRGYDLDIWLPQFCIIALGTNDISQQTWRKNMALLIAKAVANGAEPILCTQVPRPAVQALRTSMNADIRAMYFGRYRYIDMAAAVSLNHDGVTWDTLYNFGDDTHPNAAGQNKMYAQAQMDLPALFV